MSARDELAPLRVLDAHKPTHSEYAGGWWELACTGCDFAEGRRLSHLDWAPHHEHRAEVFRDALAAAGYRKPRTITTCEELDALTFQAVVLDSYGTPYVCERHATDLSRNEWRPAGLNHLEESDTILYHGDVTVVYEGDPKP